MACVTQPTTSLRREKADDVTLTVIVETDRHVNRPSTYGELSGTSTRFHLALPGKLRPFTRQA